jgi:hypothetical protein
MLIKLSENEFGKLGLVADPGDPSQVVTAATLETLGPDESWDLDRLGSYASASLAEADRLTAQAAVLTRRSSIQVRRAGHALSLARQKLKLRKEWCGWLQGQGIARTTAWESIGLFENTESEDEVAELSPTEAKQRYGVISTPQENLEEFAESNATKKQEKPPTRTKTTARKTESRPAPVEETVAPPKEPESLLKKLCQVVRWLEYFEEDFSKLDWTGESPADYHRVLDEVDHLLWQIREGVPDRGRHSE